MDKPIQGITLVILTFSLSLGIFMNVLDTSIANVSIPYIAGDLAVSPDQGTWVITSFAVTSAIALPLTGWLAKRFGEIRLFIFATFLFTIISVLCGLSTNLEMLLFFRVLQGAAAGPMIPLSQSLLLSVYPEEKKGFATALWSMTAVLAPIFGPIIGGWITYNYSWPWIFFINLPVGLLSCIVTGIILSGRETSVSKSPIDFFGIALLIIGIGSLQILLDKGNDLDWFNSNVIITLTIISIVALSFLIVWELTEKFPIIDLKLFSGRNFAIGTIAVSLGYMVFFGNIVIFPLWLQTQENYTATWAGLATAPIGILSLILSPFVGTYVQKIDPRIFVSIGFLAFSIVSFWAAYTYHPYINFYGLVLPRFFQGIGIACFFTPLIVIIISGLPKERMASALGLANFLRILGGSFGTSISVTIWDRREQFHHWRLATYINPFSTSSNQTANTLVQHGLTPSQAYSVIDNYINRQAYSLSTNDVLWLTGVLFFILLALTWFTRPPFVTTNGPSAAE